MVTTENVAVIQSIGAAEAISASLGTFGCRLKKPAFLFAIFPFEGECLSPSEDSPSALRRCLDGGRLPPKKSITAQADRK